MLHGVGNGSVVGVRTVADTSDRHVDDLRPVINCVAQRLSEGGTVRITFGVRVLDRQDLGVGGNSLDTLSISWAVPVSGDERGHRSAVIVLGLSVRRIT